MPKYAAMPLKTKDLANRKTGLTNAIAHYRQKKFKNGMTCHSVLGARHSPDPSACGRIVLMRSGSDTAWITDRAKHLGFDLCGVAPAEAFPELAQVQTWLAKGYAGEMNYLADPRREDPQKVLPGVRSVIVCALNYNTSHPRSIEAIVDEDAKDGEPSGWISRYAWGADYHEVLRTKLDQLLADIREQFDESFDARAYTDTGPLHERIFAKHAGLGWLGKNTLLLNQTLGSYFFLGAILTTLELSPSLQAADSPAPDLCGSCTRCIDACPTDALVEPYIMDARRCISYLTIELRGSIPEQLRESMGSHIFGCDICQDVCPWNRRAPSTAAAEFQPRSFQPDPDDSDKSESFFLPRLEWIASITEEDYKTIFRNSPMKRAKRRGLIRNACIALGNSKIERGTNAHARIISLLERLASFEDASISESAFWALSRIQ
jgi:epoxyqueuosine reductase